MPDIEGARPMMTRCHDCAFTPGTGAHGCEITRVLALALLRSRGSFDCHVSPVPCAGFEEAKARMEASSFYDQQPEWKEKVWHAMADAIVNARESADAGEAFLRDFRARLEEIG